MLILGSFFELFFSAVDVWSAACILAEMITGQVLFRGQDSIHTYFNETLYAQLWETQPSMISDYFNVKEIKKGQVKHCKGLLFLVSR